MDKLGWQEAPWICTEPGYLLVWGFDPLDSTKVIYKD